MKLLSPRLHGYVDYTVVVLLALAPLTLRLDPVPASACYVAALGHFIVSLLSDHPLGASGKIPLAVHGALELVLGAGLLAAPWLLGFAAPGRARTFFVAAGIALVTLAVSTRILAGADARASRYDRYDR
ncbi:SPW repeat domain-containing protein [Sorangium sp. So ce131]|uniref:SPW repeat domain-containing protein n=1 Tax=Sorangium sp. So ce131 TaxID=3133282 RepID=UPI003F5E3D2C